MRNSHIVVGAAFAGFIAGVAPLSAEDTTFRNYRCDDGTEFIVGYYPNDSRAYLQIDGGSATLRRRFALSGTRYAGDGVVLRISKAGRTTVKRPKRAETACLVL